MWSTINVIFPSLFLVYLALHPYFNNMFSSSEAILFEYFAVFSKFEKGEEVKIYF